MRLLKIVAVMALTFGLAVIAGCAAPGVKTAMNPIIVPHRANISMARIGIFSFRTPFQDTMLESQLAHHMHQLLLSRRAARVVEVIPERFRDINEAIDRARVLGYDVAVLGQLQEAFWGGSVEPSKATVDIRVVDTVRRITVWYLSSSARAKPRGDKDLLLWRTNGARARTPMELVGRLLAQMSDQLILQTRQQLQAIPTQTGEPAEAPQNPTPPPEVNSTYKPTESGVQSPNRGTGSGPLKISREPSG